MLAKVSREGTIMISEFGVEGMTCGNCVRHVTEELSDVYGVEAVEVVLVAGGVSTVTVRGSAPVDAGAVATAVAEAGYRVVAR
jgi:copper chaperone